MASGKPYLRIYYFEGGGHDFNNDTLAHHNVPKAAALARQRLTKILVNFGPLTQPGYDSKRRYPLWERPSNWRAAMAMK